MNTILKRQHVFSQKLSVLFFLALLIHTTAANAKPEVPNDANIVNPIKVGQSIPSLKLKDIEGKPFDLNKAISQQPTILIFYRGSWCPYCNTHLGELKNIESELIKLGYQIIAISPDLPKNLEKSINEHDLTYTLISDSKAEAAKALGLAFKVDNDTHEKYMKHGINLEAASGENHRILPVPAAIVLNQEGFIEFIFFSPDYKVRIDNDVLLSAAKSALN